MLRKQTNIIPKSMEPYSKTFLISHNKELNSQSNQDNTVRCVLVNKILQWLADLLKSVYIWVHVPVLASNCTRVCIPWVWMGRCYRDSWPKVSTNVSSLEISASSHLCIRHAGVLCKYIETVTNFTALIEAWVDDYLVPWRWDNTKRGNYWQEKTVSAGVMH